MAKINEVVGDIKHHHYSSFESIPTLQLADISIYSTFKLYFSFTIAKSNYKLEMVVKGSHVTMV